MVVDEKERIKGRGARGVAFLYLAGRGDSERTAVPIRLVDAEMAEAALMGVGVNGGMLERVRGLETKEEVREGNESAAFESDYEI